MKNLCAQIKLNIQLKLNNKILQISIEQINCLKIYNRFIKHFKLSQKFETQKFENMQKKKRNKDKNDN